MHFQAVNMELGLTQANAVQWIQCMETLKCAGDRCNAETDDTGVGNAKTSV